jgi:hypothetical protein
MDEAKRLSAGRTDGCVVVQIKPDLNGRGVMTSILGMQG